jgi:hypothetical protein
MKLIKDLVKFLIFPFVFAFGYFYFLFTNKTLPLSYAAFRFLFVKTNGGINNFMAKLLKKNIPVEAVSSPVFGQLTQQDIQRIIESIEKDGFYVFEQTLSEETIEALLNFALSEKTKSIDVNQSGVKYLPEKIVFDPNNPVSPRYQFESADLVKNETIRNIAFDAGMRKIAEGYLKCQPILDIVTMWWSVPFGKKAMAQSAQMYHFDMDRFKFLKFFYYVTDVHTDNGPHCYIRGSHRTLPKELLSDRRLTDEELEKIYAKEDFMEFTGKKGSILAVDTRGLHKGKTLVSDKRLLFQIQFSNSLFGAEYDQLTLHNKTEAEEAYIAKHPRTYQLFK